MQRRRFCRWVAAGGLAATAGCLGGRGLPGRDARPGAGSTPPWRGIPADAWPSFGGDPGNTGYRPDGRGPERGEVAWRAVGTSGTVNSGAAVVGDTVFVGSATPEFHALDAGTGEQRWNAFPRSYVETVPTVREGTVYFADADGIVWAYSTDGERKWRKRTDHNLHSRSLSVAEGLVIVGAAGALRPEEQEEAGDRTSHVLALDADTGERRWSFQGRDWFTGPAVADGRVYVANHAGPVYALDVATGDPVWYWRPRENVLTPPTAHRGSVYLAVSGLGVVALDWDGGRVQWTREFEYASTKSSPAVGGGRVYVATSGSRDAPVGEPTPSTTTTDEGMAGGYAVGAVHALDADTGDRVWRNLYDHDIRSPPTVREDVVYVGGAEGLHAVTTEGKDLWHRTFGDYVGASPAVVDGRAYVGSADGHLYCLGSG